jgi:hypothetical protein
MASAASPRVLCVCLCRGSRAVYLHAAPCRSVPLAAPRVPTRPHLSFASPLALVAGVRAVRERGGRTPRAPCRQLDSTPTPGPGRREASKWEKMDQAYQRTRGSVRKA